MENISKESLLAQKAEKEKYLEAIKIEMNGTIGKILMLNELLASLEQREEVAKEETPKA